MRDRYATGRVSQVSGGPRRLPTGIGTCFHSPVATGDRGTAPAPASALARSQAGRRRRVLDAALALAARGGFDAVQMRDVAAEAGVALGTVYRYFESKERLLIEAHVEQVEDLAERLRASPPRGGGAAERVVEVLRRSTRHLVRRPEATAAMVRALGRARPEEADVVERVKAAMTDIITVAIHADGRPPDGAGRDLAVARVLQQVWFSSLIGWVGGVDPAGRVDADLESAARLLLDGPGARLSG